MFRKATQRPKNQPPCYMLVCDDPRCDCVVRMEIPDGEPEADVRAAMLSEAAEKGWGISLEGQWCALHIPRWKQDEHAGKRLISIVRTLPGVVS